MNRCSRSKTIYVVAGMEQFSAASTAMLLGEDSPALAAGRVSI